MSLHDIPSVLRVFILDEIHSVEQLEILLLLAARREISWTPEEVAKELRTSVNSAGRWLQYLKSRRLLVDAYRFEPPSADVDKLIGDLRVLYSQRRVSLIELIFNKPASQVQSFANAFRVKEDKKDG